MFPLVDDKSCLGMGYYRSSCIRCPYGYTEELTSLFSQMGRGIIPVEVPLAALAKQPGSSWGLGTKFLGVFPLAQALRFKEHFILPSALHQLAEGDCIVTSAELFIRPRQKVNTDAEFLIRGGLFRQIYSATTTPKHTHSADATPGLSIM